MRNGRWNRRGGPGGALAVLVALVALGPGTAQAAGPPILGAAWSVSVQDQSARLRAEIDANGNFTTYHFDYLTEAAYQANVAALKDPFAGALRVPPANDANFGSLPAPPVTQLLFGLSPDTAYRYRVVAKNPAGTATGSARTFITHLKPSAALADSRGWEMVSPIDKNGGEVAAVGHLAGGGVLQAAAAGGSLTYGSLASFAGGVGAPPASQYLATRTAGGWVNKNLNPPIFSGSYETEGVGVPYQLFSPDLTRALLLNGEHCRGEGTGCAVANPPLAGTDAPAGYQDYYLRETGGFRALLGSANAGYLALSPAEFDLSLVGATADLHHVVLSSCAAITADATEVPGPEGCDPTQQNLYRWSGAGLTLINLLPGEAQGNHHAELAAQSGAISADGSRVYWSEPGGDLYLREGGQAKHVDEDAGGGGTFQVASLDGAVAFYTVAGHLWRYLVASAHSTDLTPAGGVLGVLGASADGADVYYQDAAGLKRWRVSTTTIAPGPNAADAGNWPPATGSARVSADGTKLLFVSKAPLTGYDNTDLTAGVADTEVFLYDATAADPLRCVSCNPTLERPLGPSSVPGAIANGSAPGSFNAYKPRVLSADGRRVFFNSGDALHLADTNASAPDVYQWEAQGKGSCTRLGGCVSLISSGHSAAGASFIDAAADGSDAFFLTDDSLVPSDSGSVDIYDARVGGGFPVPTEPIPCTGDSCQPLPSAPVDPTLTTLLSGRGNPAVSYRKLKRRHRKKHHRKGKHGSKGHGKPHHRRGRGR